VIDEGDAMTADEDVLRRAAALFHRRFAVWWRPRYSPRWRQIGSFPNVITAGAEMERRLQRGDGGTFRALAAGRDPTELDQDDEDAEPA
jgi:hypothetical protein